MFKIIEKISYPIRLPIKPNVKLKPGMVGRITDFENNTVIDIGNSHMFSGIIGNRRYSNTASISWEKEHLVKIWTGRMIFRTDMFDRSSKFKDSRIYVNKEGLLTSEEPFDDACIVARLISGPSDSRKWLEALFL